MEWIVVMQRKVRGGDEKIVQGGTDAPEWRML